jgi:putative addiction module component (TIGR02574 family)
MIMNIAVEQLKSQMTSLTPDERAELAQFLIQTLDVEPEEGVEAAWELELARRADEILSGKAKGKPAEQVFAEIRARYS